jgi:hypothetical protein
MDSESTISVNMLRSQRSSADRVYHYELDDTGFESRQAQNNFSSPKVQKDSRANPVGCVVKLTIHFQLVPRLRMSGAMPPLSLCLHAVDRDNFNVSPSMHAKRQIAHMLIKRQVVKVYGDVEL